MKPQRRGLKQVSRVASIPAPSNGWNAKDQYTGMKPEDAIVLDNLIPTASGIILRNGFSSHVTGLGAAVQSLMEHSAPAGTRTLFGAAGTSIFNVTAAGAVGAASLTSLGNAKFQHVMFGTSGGNFLVICNGSASVRNYNGASWTTPSITAVTSANLINVAVHANRLWFVEKNTLDAWYLPVSSIAGAATKFPLGAQAKLGGTLQAIGSWSRDGGSGSDDVCVFLTSAGEVFLYAGTDPDFSNTWRLVGRFRIPEPIGHRCMVKVGADLAVITSQGVLPLSVVLPITASVVQRAAATDRIQGAFEEAYRANSSLYGWQIIEYPKGGLSIVNVPQSDGTQAIQYVMYTQTGAWCRFTSINALCWSLLGDVMYFGTSAGTVYKYHSATYADDGAAIRWKVLTAFSDLKHVGNKRVVMGKPVLIAAEGTAAHVTVKTDYDTSPAAETISAIPADGPSWDTGDWDVTAWGPSQVTLADWQSVVAEPGHAVAVLLQGSSLTPLTLTRTDLMYEPGGIL